VINAMGENVARGRRGCDTGSRDKGKNTMRSALHSTQDQRKGRTSPRELRSAKRKKRQLGGWKKGRRRAWK